MFPRKPFDLGGYVERTISRGDCFICEIVQGNLKGNYPVYMSPIGVVFLNKYPTLYGYTLVAPRAHKEGVTSEFSVEEYLALQRLVYHVAEALQQEVPTERLYILSLGSQQGNRHVHWHLAPLPQGVPFEQQQFDALNLERGVLDIPESEMRALAERLRLRIERVLVE